MFHEGKGSGRSSECMETLVRVQGTGGWLRAGGEEERYVMIWSSPTTQLFELPTGGCEFMRQDKNLISFARKEQCLALGKQLRTTFKINDYKIFRVLPDGQVILLHPKDAVFPEKVNTGRVLVGAMEANIGKIKG